MLAPLPVGGRPQFDRSMNTGSGKIGVEAKGDVAHQTVFHGGVRASRLEFSSNPPLQGS